MSKEFRSLGYINSEGKLKIYDQKLMDLVNQDNKNKKVIIQLKVIGRDINDQMIGYFKNYVLLEFRKAIHELEGEYLTLEETERYISPYSKLLKELVWCDEAKDWVYEYKKFQDLDKDKMILCLLQLNEISSSNFGFKIKYDW